MPIPTEERISMEKLSRHKKYTKFYPLTKLYRDDIEELTDLFLKNFSTIDIEADGYKLDDIYEINNLKKDEIYDFNLTGYGENAVSYNVWLSINKNSITLYINDINKCNI